MGRNIMNLEKLFFDPEEKPLDNLVSNGGFCGIFRTIGCVGDSLSSGEFETCDICSAESELSAALNKM